VRSPWHSLGDYATGCGVSYPSYRKPFPAITVLLPSDTIIQKNRNLLFFQIVSLSFCEPERTKSIPSCVWCMLIRQCPPFATVCIFLSECPLGFPPRPFLVGTRGHAVPGPQALLQAVLGAPWAGGFLVSMGHPSPIGGGGNPGIPEFPHCGQM